MIQRKSRYTNTRISILLILIMIMTPLNVLSTYANPVCHVEHDAECGYAKTITGTACTHVHDENCFVQQYSCSQLHVHNESCLASDCDVEEHTHTEGVCYTNVLECNHQHDSGCGYAEAQAGHPCEHQCPVCYPAALIKNLPKDDMRFVFVKDTDSQYYRDMALVYDLNADTLLSVWRDTGEKDFWGKIIYEELISPQQAIEAHDPEIKVEYSVDFIGTITISKEYLAQLKDGVTVFKLVFESEEELLMPLTILNVEDTLLSLEQTELECTCGREMDEHDESCPLHIEPLCICCFDEHGDGHEHEHDICCPLYQALECICGTKTDVHSEDCSLYAGPYCDCDKPDGPHNETCPLYQVPVYMSVTNHIDALPSLDEVKFMDLNRVREVQQRIYEIRDMIADQVSGLTEAEGFERFDAELGEERIKKYNCLFGYVEEYIYNNTPRSRGLSGAISINIAIGWFRITGDSTTQYLTQYNAGTATILAYYPYSADGYRIYGSNTTDYIRCKIQVMPGVTDAHLYFDGITLDNRSNGCIRSSGADVTITLVDGTINNLSCAAGGSGTGLGYAVIEKNDAMDGCYLKINCEAAEAMGSGHICDPSVCGVMNLRGTALHVAAIGSSWPSGTNQGIGGFANLYIEGGIIEARSGDHTPGIGAMCGTAHVPSSANAQFLRGQYCKNINISGGRVYAYGGEYCAGIGSGWGGPVDGIYISNGAYVYAQGGTGSPGIGSGGTHTSNAVYAGDGPFNVSNITISGGLTVVEAVGGTSLHSSFPYAPGIGCGHNNAGRTGTLTNVQSKPEDGWYAMVKQGTSKADAAFIDGTPSDEDVDIIADMYYTLCYFTQLEKTACVNGGALKNGAADDMIQVYVGDRVKYIIDTQSGETGAQMYDITDEIPEGMTLVTTPGSYFPGMTWDTVSGVTTVKWLNQDGGHEFYFTVTVGSLAGVSEREYINQAIRTELNVSIVSTETYHHADNVFVTLQVKKIIENYGTQSTAMQAELASHLFIISLSGDVNGNVPLKHNQTSGIMLMTLDTPSVSVTVTEIVPMEFAVGYTVSALITHWDGTSDIQTGSIITFQQGDDVLITVMNTFTPKSFFKGWTWIHNIFENELTP